MTRKRGRAGVSRIMIQRSTHRGYSCCCRLAAPRLPCGIDRRWPCGGGGGGGGGGVALNELESAPPPPPRARRLRRARGCLIGQGAAPPLEGLDQARDGGAPPPPAARPPAPEHRGGAGRCDGSSAGGELETIMMAADGGETRRAMRLVTRRADRSPSSGGGGGSHRQGPVDQGNQWQGVEGATAGPGRALAPHAGPGPAGGRGYPLRLDACPSPSESLSQEERSG